MEIRAFFSRKRPFEDTSVEPEVSFTDSGQDALVDGQTSQPPPSDVQSAQPTRRKMQSLSVSEKKSIYKANHSYKRNGRRNINGSSATIPVRVCLWHLSGVFLLLAQKVHGQ